MRSSRGASSQIMPAVENPTSPSLMLCSSRRTKARRSLRHSQASTGCSSVAAPLGLGGRGADGAGRCTELGESDRTRSLIYQNRPLASFKYDGTRQLHDPHANILSKWLRRARNPHMGAASAATSAPAGGSSESLITDCQSPTQSDLRMPQMPNRCRSAERAQD